MDAQSLQAPARSRPLVRIGAVVAVAVLVVIAGLAVFPWNLVRGPAERQLSRRYDRPVSIGAIERSGSSFTLTPTIVIRGVRVPHADWAGAGDVVKIETMRLQLSMLPLLVGKVDVGSVAIEGARFDLVRDAEGRKSWSTGKDDDDDAGTGLSSLRDLTISDSVLRYRDAKRDRSFTAAVASDRTGVRIDGDGVIRGEPVKLQLRGAAITSDNAAKKWPFRAEIEGAAVGLTATGTMDHPLDVGHLSADVTGHGRDLKMLDAIIEAGLPGTQPVTVKASVRRDRKQWRISDLSGTVGRSDFAGEAVVRKHDGRSRIDATIRSRQFDFDDLSSDEGRARGAEKRRRLGKRLIPDTAIDLQRLARTDGRLDVKIGELLWPGPSPLRNLAGVLELDRSRLTVTPLVIGLTHGTMRGKAIVDQRAAADKSAGPVLTLDLALEEGRLMDFAPDTGVDGRLAGALKLAGPGKTVRQAIGRSTGSIVLAARDGELPARTASLLGQDVGRSLLTGKDRLATLNCLVMDLDVRHGVARTRPLTIDTSRSVTDIAGTVSLADERLDLQLTGAPKQASVLRLEVPIVIAGTIKDPEVTLPEHSRSARNVLRMLGRAVTGRQGPLAAPVDCNALVSGRALKLGNSLPAAR